MRTPTQQVIRMVLGALAMLTIIAPTGRTAVAQITTAENAGVIYRLTNAATYQRGCFSPCLCPIMESGTPRGTFILTPLPTSTLTMLEYRVDEVNLLVGVGNAERRITGRGLFRRAILSATGLAQRMELDLRIDNLPLERFDSGWTIASVAFPAINLTISINGGVCFDTVIDMAAAPVPVSQLIPLRLTNASTWQSGCFPPCTCPLPPPRAMIGSLVLVPMPSPVIAPVLPTEYAVARAVLHVPSPTIMSTNTPTTASMSYQGSGFYRRNIPSPTITNLPGQQMFLDLQPRLNVAVITPPQRFDSGIVPITVGWPLLDITLSRNGMVCMDTVLRINASPLSIAQP